MPAGGCDLLPGSLDLKASDNSCFHGNPFFTAEEHYTFYGSKFNSHVAYIDLVATLRLVHTYDHHQWPSSGHFSILSRCIYVYNTFSSLNCFELVAIAYIGSRGWFHVNI